MITSADGWNQNHVYLVSEPKDPASRMSPPCAPHWGSSSRRAASRQPPAACAGRPSAPAVPARWPAGPQLSGEQRTGPAAVGACMSSRTMFSGSADKCDHQLPVHLPKAQDEQKNRFPASSSGDHRIAPAAARACMLCRDPNLSAELIGVTIVR